MPTDRFGDRVQSSVPRSLQAVDRVIVVEKEKTTLLKQALLPKEGTDAH